MTLRSELFSIWQKEIEPSVEYWHKKKILLYWMRFERVVFFLNDSKNWNFLKNMTHRIETFFSNTTHRIELFVWYDSKNLNLFLIRLKELNFFLNTTHRIEPTFSLNMTKELNSFFFDYESKNWTHFVDMTQRIELFFHWPARRTELFLNTAQRSEHFKIRLKQLEHFLFYYEDDSKFFFFKKMWLKEFETFFVTLELNLFFSQTTQRIEPFFFWTWLQEFELFFHVTQRIENFELL